ncbi:TetR/AcrR family transcriptional regulator [Secundilactobacillus collinoides]|uniref:TetR/AcrR family transcriptional regulator n=1 Tax=Secundilactobacillus collinoides TaxID=33960 RepID=UPI0007EE95FB|nr:TetR family transcriptional regulator [Secundilactobacillus collinoides]
MKYDLSKKPTRGAQRTLYAFSHTAMALLAQKPFEDINVNEICNQSNFPRATFYNYFDDKYDLVNYVWYLLAKDVGIDDVSALAKNDDLLLIYFDRLYDLFEHNSRLLDSILKHNEANGTLLNSFTRYLRDTIHRVFTDHFGHMKFRIPVELMVDQCCSTVMMLLEWIFLKQQPTTKAQAHQYLAILISDPDMVVVPSAASPRPDQTAGK